VSERKFRILSHAEEVNSAIPNNHIGKSDELSHSCTHMWRNCLLFSYASAPVLNEYKILKRMGIESAGRLHGKL